MVYVNSQKFACESCIKGHRSSLCHHTDRPLFEIKKKGRPVSQCHNCRTLRLSRRVHSKCTCSKDKSTSLSAMQPLASSSKVKRYMPIAPALPNGLKDVLRTHPAPNPSNSRQLVQSLLNPCTCRNLWECKCQGEKVEEKASASSVPATVHFAPDLPPILNLLEEDPTPSAQPTLIPPISAIASFAGSGCTCGVECSCPGCEEHRGAQHVDRTHGSCPNECSHCVDSRMGIALPGLESSPTVSMIDQFFRRAAALPTPPSNRKKGSGAELDPANIITYPEAARGTKEQGNAFGLISLPKLKCCAGKCACVPNSCHCRDSCNGCCAENNSSAAPPSPPVVRRSCCANKA